MIKRIWTSCLLVSIAVGALLAAHEPYLRLLFLVILCAPMCWEWARIAGLSERRSALIYTLAVLAVLAGILLAGSPVILAGFPIMLVAYPVMQQSLIIFGCLFWGLATIYLLSYPRWNRFFWGLLSVRLITGALIILCMANALLWVFESVGEGVWILLYLLCTVWGMDIGGFIGGRKFGRHKLAPSISPKKTVEGALSGLFLGSLMGLCIVFLAPEPIIESPVTLVLLTLFLGVVSIVGDLFESAAKREAGVKDSGNLFPGHGGALDRLDSLSAAAPALALALLLCPQPGEGQDMKGSSATSPEGRELAESCDLALPDIGAFSAPPALPDLQRQDALTLTSGCEQSVSKGWGQGR